MSFTVNQLGLLALCLLGLLNTGLSLRCIECNVWKAGYGHLCDNPLIRDDCLASSTIISRVCVKTKVPEFGDECHFYDMAGGINIECYCNSDECNSSHKLHLSLITIMTALVISVISTWHLL
ncbi:hypothetical protein LSH36_7g17022 [Paralvinella palmiformis]|uniref:Protein quiver n=1 Tax=Paralvinella palmiformis TaxID=53620 RepID=A0AAD9KDR3_9ANNE|nr:hypothetical protein LSH36_7g17022 [Paralvinella palmiformis]